MKRSDIRQLIREEIIKELRTKLHEAFADPIASKLAKMAGMSNKWKNFWRSSAKTYDIAWDKVPKGSFRTVSTSDAAAKKGMAFWIATSEKATTRSGYSWDNVKPGVVAVTIDGKIQYFAGSGGIGSKGSMGARRRGEPVGQGKRGTLQYKKLPEYSDIVYIFDLESYRGGTKELKAKRAKLQLGKDVFTDPKAWKRANLQRYHDMIADKIGTKGKVEKMTAEIVKWANEAIIDAMGLQKTTEYGDIEATLAGNAVKMDDVTRYMSNALQAFSRYIQSENSQAKHAKKYPEYAADSYELGAMKEKAMDIKSIHDQFKKGKFKW
jgi:hypothetical protein